MITDIRAPIQTNAHLRAPQPNNSPSTIQKQNALTSDEFSAHLRQIEEQSSSDRAAQWVLEQSHQLVPKTQKDFETILQTKNAKAVFDFLKEDPNFKMSKQDDPSLDLAKRLSILGNVARFPKNLLQEVRLINHRAQR